MRRGRVVEGGVARVTPSTHCTTRPLVLTLHRAQITLHHPPPPSTIADTCYLLRGQHWRVVEGDLRQRRVVAGGVARVTPSTHCTTRPLVLTLHRAQITLHHPPPLTTSAETCYLLRGQRWRVVEGDLRRGRVVEGGVARVTPSTYCTTRPSVLTLHRAQIILHHPPPLTTSADTCYLLRG